MDYLGYIAGAFTTGSTIPQLIKTIRTKEAADVSIRMYIMYLSGSTLWVLYGVLRSDWSIVIANGVAVLLTLTMLILKMKYNKQSKYNKSLSEY